MGQAWTVCPTAWQEAAVSNWGIHEWMAALCLSIKTGKRRTCHSTQSLLTIDNVHSEKTGLSVYDLITHMKKS